MTVIALTGYARSGKDTVGDILIRDHGFKRVTFGDILKRVAEDTDPIIEVHRDDEDAEPFTCSVRHMLSVCGGWERVKDEIPEARQWLVDLGDSLRRHIPGVETTWWLDSAQPSDRIVNTNVYHPEEIDRIRAHGGIVVRVTRPGVGPANPVEARTGDHPVEYVLRNGGTLKELAHDVATFVQMVVA